MTVCMYDQNSLVFTFQNSFAKDIHVPHFCLQITFTAHKAASDSLNEQQNGNWNDVGNRYDMWQDDAPFSI